MPRVVKSRGRDSARRSLQPWSVANPREACTTLVTPVTFAKSQLLNLTKLLADRVVAVEISSDGSFTNSESVLAVLSSCDIDDTIVIAIFIFAIIIQFIYIYFIIKFKYCLYYFIDFV